MGAEAPRRRRAIAVAAAALVLIGAAIAVVRSRPGGARRAAIDAGRPPVAAVVADAGVADAGAADASVAAAYVGSARCGECHPDEHRGWQRSWHARALARAGKASVVGDFRDVHVAGESSEAWMKRAGGRYLMTARGADGALADFPVDWVIGGKRMQDTVTVFPDGRWQVLPLYFHVSGKRWVDYTEAKQGALTPEHPFYWTNARRMANHECLDCHTTGLAVDHDEASGRWTTRFADDDVACEECHGPGSVHAGSQEAADILQPRDRPDVGLAACARCHGPRRPLYPVLDRDHRFVLGKDAYDERYDPVVMTLPDGMSGDFFVDGRPKTSSFEYQALIQSACYRQGGATCLSCHTAPHQRHRPAELAGKRPDDVYRDGHRSLVAGAAAHSHHRAPAAQRCVACHMPPVVTGVLDRFADHALDVPAPATTIAHGVPNACGVCHTDRDASSLAASLAAWWPDAAAKQARRARLADAFADGHSRDNAKALVAVVDDAGEAPTLRGAAAVVMARRYGLQTAPRLLPLLAADDVTLRAKACEALGSTASPAAGAAAPPAAARVVGDALAAHTADRSLRVRQACALALFDTGDPRGEPALAALAASADSAHLLKPHQRLGLAHARRHEWPDARRELMLVARLAPYSPEAQVDLASVAASQGDLAFARARLAAALALEPRNPAALRLQAQLRPAP